jgi:hypothetical protein
MTLPPLGPVSSTRPMYCLHLSLLIEVLEKGYQFRGKPTCQSSDELRLWIKFPDCGRAVAPESALPMLA